jgi:hypothetical protein
MQNKIIFLLLAMQIITVCVSLHWIGKMADLCDEAQDLQFTAEMQNIELKFKLQQIEMKDQLP